MNEFVSDSAVGEYGYLMDRGLVPLETSTLSKVRSNVKNLNPISMQETTVPTADQVVGIFQVIMKEFFEHFYRIDVARSRKLVRTGLALSIVKHIIQAHQGLISLTSTKGEGSTFLIQNTFIEINLI